MEDSGSSRLEGVGSFRKRRTRISRRPKPDSQPTPDGRDISSLSSTPPTDDPRAGSSDDNSGGDHGYRRKEVSLSQCASRFPATSGVKKSKKVDVGLDELYGNSRNGGLPPTNPKSTVRVKDSLESQKTKALNSIKVDETLGLSLDGLGSDNKLKKIKVKVGGVTRTIDANSSAKSSRASGVSLSRQKSVRKDTSDNDNSLSPPDNKGGLQGIPWKDFSREGFSLRREESLCKENANSHPGRQGDRTDAVRKSKRLPKKRAIDRFDDDDDNDDEIRYLEKLKYARFSAGIRDEDEESSKKHKRLSKVSGNIPENLEGSVSSRSSKDGKKRSPSEDIDYDEEEEVGSDGELESRKTKKARKDTVESLVEPKHEMTLTTRQKALQSGRDSSVAVEFPNGLPPAPPRKPKEKLTEVEQQLKKAEAAEKRRMHNEKAARESEAEAIRKILGQDSSRKKREDKKKKRVEEMAQERAADEILRASNSIRLIMGPTGTTVTFPNDMGWPSLFESKPRSYPPPREKCAGPSCINPYKYRDSKTKLPLCSLQCYKAVQGNKQNEALSMEYSGTC